MCQILSVRGRCLPDGTEPGPQRGACGTFLSHPLSLFQALDEEKLVYERSSSKNIYLNVAVNTLKKLRSKSNSCSSPGTSTLHRTTPYHTSQQNTILYQQTCKFDYYILFYAPKHSNLKHCPQRRPVLRPTEGLSLTSKFSGVVLLPQPASLLTGWANSRRKRSLVWPRLRFPFLCLFV